MSKTSADTILLIFRNFRHVSITIQETIGGNRKTRQIVYRLDTVESKPSRTKLINRTRTHHRSTFIRFVQKCNISALILVSEFT